MARREISQRFQTGFGDGDGQTNSFLGQCTLLDTGIPVSVGYFVIYDYSELFLYKQS